MKKSDKKKIVHTETEVFSEIGITDIVTCVLGSQGTWGEQLTADKKLSCVKHVMTGGHWVHGGSDHAIMATSQPRVIHISSNPCLHLPGPGLDQGCFLPHWDVLFLLIPQFLPVAVVRLAHSDSFCSVFL